MVARIRARDRDELIDLINQVLDDVDDLRAAIEYDEEFMGNAAMIVEPISVELNKLQAAIRSGEYQIGEDGWLDFVIALQNADHHTIPFWPLLKLILETHQRGYQERS
jgi:hypothetical protein